MSRSAQIALVSAAVLLGLVVVITLRYVHGLAHHDVLVAALGPAIAVLGASTIAVSVRRIVDPTLPTPILVWIGLSILVALYFVLMIASALGGRRRGDRDEDEHHHHDHHDHHDHHHHHHDHHHHHRSWFSRHRSSSDPPSLAPAKPGMGMGNAIVATVLSLGIYVGGMAMIPWMAKTAPAPARRIAHVPRIAPPARDIKDAPDLAAAIDQVRPAIEFGGKVPSEGAGQLARYAAAHLTWRDVADATESSLARAAKAPKEELGKRLCATGTLSWIGDQQIGNVGVRVAQLVTRDGEALVLYAVGDAGELAKGSPARFCGVVAGQIADGGKLVPFGVGLFEPPAEKL